MSVESTNRMMDELWKVISYYEQEYDIAYAEVVGALEIMKASLIQSCFDATEDGEGVDTE